MNQDEIIDNNLIGRKFVNPADEQSVKPWLDVTDYEFISFLTTPAFKDFEVLHSICLNDLEEGFYRINVTSWNNIKMKEVKKEIVIKNLTHLGGSF